MRPRRVISFTGLAGSGKTTAANMLCLQEGYYEPQLPSLKYRSNAVRLSLAAPLKGLCVRAFPWLDPSVFTGTQEQKEAPILDVPDGWSGRRILQHIGTEGFRAIDPNIWVRTALHTIQTLPAHIKLVVVDDVRFENERAALAEYGPVYRIVRPGLQASTHASEAAVTSLKVTAEIINDKTLLEFNEIIRALHAES